MYFSKYNDFMMLPQNIVIPSVSQPISDLKKGIELRNVSFRYDNNCPWVLRNVNLFISSDKSLALIGLNGAGKTTLVKLLTRMYDPTEGEILWDGIDIKKFDPNELRKRIGTIFQDFVQYDLTAYENIALGDISCLEQKDNNIIEKAVHESAKKAGADELIRALPNGYKTLLSCWLSEDGSSIDLSGGQWQKIALARLFMRDATLLILDEPTAALDTEAEYEIYHHFKELVAGKACLLISHRFSSVRMADKIAVLDNGCISEVGSHSELVAKGGKYAKLFNMQAEQYSK